MVVGGMVNGARCTVQGGIRKYWVLEREGRRLEVGFAFSSFWLEAGGR